MTYDDLRALMPEIDAQIAQMVARIPREDLADKPPFGAQARMEAALTAPFLLWLTHEVRRIRSAGGRPQDLAIGAAAGLGALVKSLADNLAEEGHQIAFVRCFLNSLEVDLKLRLRADAQEKVRSGETIKIDLASGAA